MKIVVLDGYTLNPGDNPWAPLEHFGELTVYDRTAKAQILERASEADIVLTNKVPLDAATINQLPKLKLISVLATGFNVVDIEAARARDIPVCNVPAYSTDAVAEFVFAMILDFFKQVRHHSQLCHGGRWQNAPDFSFWENDHFHEMAGKTIGIIGFGQIGQRVGELASAFRFEILANSRSRTAETVYPFDWAEIDAIFEQADVISLHCPLTPETQSLVDARRLSLMKRNGFLINTARGPLVDEAALRHALDSEQIAGAACDVVSAEPIEASNPLLGAKNLILTPHIAWAAIEARQRLMQITAKNLQMWSSGEPQNVVN